MRKAILIILCLCSVLFAQDKPYSVINSFNSGELSPLLNAREDLAKFHSGLSQMENMIPLPQGAAQKRPGTVYVAGSKEDTKVRLFPFEYSTEQSYAIEAGNQYFRFYTDKAPIIVSTGENTTSFPQQASLKAHWKLNEITGTNVEDSQGSHDGTATIDISSLTATGQIGWAFDFATTYGVGITDHVDFSFISDGVDTAFSIAAWIKVVAGDNVQTIASKYDGQAASEIREWLFIIDVTERPRIYIYDESEADAWEETKGSDVLADGWHHIVGTYGGVGGETAEGDLKIYVNGSAVSVMSSDFGTYVDMEDTTTKPAIGTSYNAPGTLIYEFDNEIDNVIVWKGAALSAAEVTTLYALQTATAPYEVTTPYLTADLFELKMEQSADVLYITHPDYETRKLSRSANNIWALTVLGIEDGPFQDENTDVADTITPSGVTGSITLTATGHAPFKSGTTAGHLPSGSAATSKSQTGALFKIVQSLATGAYEEILSNNYTADQTEDVSWMHCGTIAKGVTWYLTTAGTWIGTLEVQRNYTIGAAHGAATWETVFPFQSNDDRNVTTNAEETVADADYRVILTATGDAAEPCQIYIRISDTDHIGIVEITAVASTTSATATVLKTLADTTASHRWSEGAWSNYRGWPQTVTFFEDRLTFGGNFNQPDTIWASVTADYENMTAGADDDEALIFTLSSRQVNVIEWIIGKNKLLIGTSGAEWTLEGGNDEPLTPSNVKAEQHSTYGSANLQATLASESVLFFQRGAEKMRELAYNWESDSYVAPDMTILVSEITGDGITDTAYQQIPNSILWCVREDGELAIFVYERKEMITSWARLITDGEFESVIAISGSAEDQVWVSVNRTIGGSTKRYIEYFSARDFGTDPCDAYFVDSGITYDSTATTTITGLTHLKAETVAVLGDGVIQTSQTVNSSGEITITSAATVQAGLPFTVKLKTMPLSFLGAGSSILGRVKRVSGLTVEYYNSGDFDYGVSETNKYAISIDGMGSDITPRKTFPAGFGKRGQVFLYQLSPEPFTIISLGLDFQVF